MQNNCKYKGLDVFWYYQTYLYPQVREVNVSSAIRLNRVARTNLFVRAVRAPVNSEYTTQTNRVCQRHPGIGLQRIKISLETPPARHLFMVF